MVSWLQLNVTFLRPPSPLLDARLNVLRCLGLVLLAGLIQVRQQQLLGRFDPTLEEELDERKLGRIRSVLQSRHYWVKKERL